MRKTEKHRMKDSVSPRLFSGNYAKVSNNEMGVKK
jgi:hypothetical protein